MDRGNFDIWIGDPEENQGWSWIKRTRDFLLREEGKGKLAPEVRAAAWEDLYAAEGSDWFWWYGPDFQTDSDLIFDGLFRGRLQNVYRRLGVTPPAGLSVPICTAEVRLGVVPTRPIEPDWGEHQVFWIGRGGEIRSVEGSGGDGARRPASEKHLLRVWREGLLFSLGFKEVAGDEVIVDFHLPAPVRLRIIRQGEEWRVNLEKSKDGVVYEQTDCVAKVAEGKGLQVQLPFSSLGWSREGGEVSFLVRVVRRGGGVERYPERGVD